MDAGAIQALEIVAGVIGGGAGTAALQYAIASMGSKRSDFETIMEARRLESVEQNKTIADLRERFLHAAEEIEILKKKMAAVEVDRDDVPVPMWIVDTAGHYLSINSRFVTEFLLPRGMSEVDVIGKTHGDIWSAATAAKLHELDDLAMKSPERRARVDNLKMNGLAEIVTVFKAPILKGRTLVGFTGLAIPHLA